MKGIRNSNRNFSRIVVRLIVVDTAIVRPVRHSQGKFQPQVISFSDANGIAVIVVDVQIGLLSIDALLAERNPVGYFFGFGFIHLVAAFQQKCSPILLQAGIAVESSRLSTNISIVTCERFVGSGHQVGICGRICSASNYREVVCRTTGIQHGDGLDSETGFIRFVHHIEAGGKAGELEVYLLAGADGSICQIQRQSLCPCHCQRYVQHTGIQQTGVILDKIRFGRTARPLHRAASGGKGDGCEVVGYYFIAIRFHRLRVVGNAIELHEQSTVQAEQSGGDVVRSSGVQHQFFGIRRKVVAVFTIGEPLLESISSVFGRGAEDVDIQRGDSVLPGGGNGARIRLVQY